MPPRARGAAFYTELIGIEKRCRLTALRRGQPRLGGPETQREAPSPINGGLQANGRPFANGPHDKHDGVPTREGVVDRVAYRSSWLYSTRGPAAAAIVFLMEIFRANGAQICDRRFGIGSPFCSHSPPVRARIAPDGSCMARFNLRIET